jgi:DNA repair protein RadC
MGRAGPDVLKQGIRMPADKNPNTGHRKRLKQKFLKTGLEGLHDYETLELLLTNAIPRRDVKPVAKDLIRSFKGLKGVFEAPYAELLCIKGIGENAACLLRLVKEVPEACLSEDVSGKKDVVRSPRDIVNILASGPAQIENDGLIAICLNSKNEVLAIELLHAGLSEGLRLSPRHVLGLAFRHNARSMIFVHKGQDPPCPPSAEELSLLRDIKAALNGVDIIVHDHIVIGGDRYISGRDAGWLDI